MPWTRRPMTWSSRPLCKMEINQIVVRIGSNIAWNLSTFFTTRGLTGYKATHLQTIYILTLLSKLQSCCKCRFGKPALKLSGNFCCYPIKTRHEDYRVFRTLSRQRDALKDVTLLCNPWDNNCGWLQPLSWQVLIPQTYVLLIIVFTSAQMMRCSQTRLWTSKEMTKIGK